jgi:hypothetical protein
MERKSIWDLTVNKNNAINASFGEIANTYKITVIKHEGETTYATLTQM